MRKYCLFLLAATGLISSTGAALAEDPAPFPPRRLPPGLQKRLPAAPPGFAGPRRSSITTTSDSLINSGSIITGDDSTFLHPKPQQDLLQAAPANLPNGAAPVNAGAGAVRTLGPRGDGNRGPLPAGVAGPMQGMQGMFGSEGTGVLPNGSKVSRDPVTGATTMTTKEGYKFTQKPDGTSVFTRTNGLETERTKDGRIRMKQDGQYTGRELKY